MSLNYLYITDKTNNSLIHDDKLCLHDMFKEECIDIVAIYIIGKIFPIISHFFVHFHCDITLTSSLETAEFMILLNTFMLFIYCRLTLHGIHETALYMLFCYLNLEIHFFQV